MSGLSYLSHRGGILYFRATVPPDLRGRIGRRELKVSLGTGLMREARGKAFALAAFVRGLIRDMRDGLMADLTSDQIFELTRREFRRILDDDRRARLRHPGDYTFGVRRPAPDGIAHEDWFNTTGLDPWDVLTATQAEYEVIDRLEGLRWPELKAPAFAMLKRFGVDVAPDDPMVNEVCHWYAKAFVEAVAAIKKREYGFHDYTPEVFLDDSVVPNAMPLAVPPVHMLSDVISSFVKEKTVSGVWDERTVKEYPKKIERLIDVMGDAVMSTVGHEFARSYKDNLIEHENKGKKLSPRTINGFLQAASGLFEWAERQGYIEKNFFHKMSLPEKRSAHDEKPVFTSDEIGVIFGGDFPGVRSREPWNFWIPLLGLYTGARVEELSQLHLSDVRQINGVWAIDINDKADDKRIKNNTSKRITPIHPFLIDVLHFPKYLDSVQASGAERVFPALKRINHKYGHAVTQWFGRLMTRLEMPQGKSFHSFRHTFTTNLLHHDVPMHVVDWLTGHAIPGETGGRYGKPPQDPVVLLPHLMKLDYGIELSHLAQSRFVVQA